MDGIERPRPLGRPRDEEIGPAILAAARRLVTEHGYDAVTTRMIAEAAGAGKQTIYRRWPNKAELILEAFLAHARTEVDRPGASPAPAHMQLAGFLQRTFAALAETAPGVRGLMATAQHDAAFRKVFRSRFIEPRRDALRDLLRTAIRDGLLPQDADIEPAVIALFGAVWYRLLLDENLDADFSERLASIILEGLSRQGRQAPPRSSHHIR